MSDVEHLREIFMDVSQGAETTTETQKEQRGRWQPRVSGDTEGIRETIEEMRDRYDLRTKLSDDQLVTLVQAFFEEHNDSQIARRIGDASLDKTVMRARLGLHLFRECDDQASFDVGGLRECLKTENSTAECAQRIGIAKSTIGRYRRVFDAKAEAERVDNQYFKRFEQYCHGDTGDGDFTPLRIEEDGLSDAVDGAGADNPQLQ